MSDNQDKAAAAAETALSRVSMDRGGVSLNNLADAHRFCKLVASSGLAPETLSTPEQVFVALQTGAEAGLGPMASLRSVIVIKGNPSWKGEAVLALIRKSRVCKTLTIGNDGEGDERRGWIRFERTDIDDGVIEVSFSWVEAKRAGLTTGKNAHTWRAYPDDMLVWRAVSRAGKRYFSDVLHGLDVAEVVRDYTTGPVKAVGIPTESTTGTAPEGLDPLLAAVGPEVVVVVDPPIGVIDPTPSEAPHEAQPTGDPEGPAPPADPEAADAGPELRDFEVHLSRKVKGSDERVVKTLTVVANTLGEAGAAAIAEVKGRGWRVTKCTAVGQGNLDLGGDS